jgi:GTPase KRas protein
LLLTPSGHAHTVSYSALRDQYMRTGEGFLCIYSITSRSSFNELNVFRDQILRVKESSGHSVGGGGHDDGSVPMVLVGNKCDLESKREVTTAEGDDLAKAFGCEHVEVSAKNGSNVEHSFFTLVREIQRRKDARDQTEAERLRRGRKRSMLKPQACALF